MPNPSGADRPVTAADLEAAVERVIRTLSERQDRAVEFIGSEVSGLRTELTRRMDTLEQRFNVQAPMILSMGAVSKAMDQLILRFEEIAHTQLARQRAIDDFVARVKRLEDRPGGAQ